VSTISHTILDKILAVKRDELAAAHDSCGELMQAYKTPARRDLLVRRSLVDALRRPSGAPVRVLAEIKRASPSAGPIRPGADPAAIAREYADAGAAAISVLTDKQFFDGDLAFLLACRAAVGVPLLRKDFLIDPVQVQEARYAGADAVLLIAAALEPLTLQIMLREAHAVALDALVEVHSLAELDIALSAPRAPNLIGVNHRDLRTFAIDMTLTEQIAKRVPADVVLVAESGIKTPDDVRRLGDAGADAVLVGEHLMRAPSPGAALRELMA
jgi:indole-3-glycerol phosphate synthase